MLNTVNFAGSQQPKTIAPETRITIAKTVFNASKSSIGDTRITLQRRDNFVVETTTRGVGPSGLRGLQSATGNLKSGFVSGVLAQLVERLNGIEEVRGSNPLGSISSLGTRRIFENGQVAEKDLKRELAASGHALSSTAWHV